MRKLISLLLIFHSILIIFVTSSSFVLKTTPSFYLSIFSYLLIVVVILFKKFKIKSFSLCPSEILCIGFLLLSFIYGIYFGCISPQWTISGLSLLFFYIFIKRINFKINWLVVAFMCIGVVQAILGLGQYVQWFNRQTESFYMRGCFDNPGGFAATLLTIFPFCLFLVSKKDFQVMGSLFSGLFIVTVFLSRSRSGIIGVIVIGLIWLNRNYKCLIKWNNSIKFITIGIILIIILSGLYFLKKDSADGRLLIWKCTAKMIVNKPLLGYGIDGFQREYMLFQADYFKSDGNSKFVMLADNTKHPFNEFLKLFAEHGFVGILILSFFIYLLIREYHRNSGSEKIYAALCIIGIATFACFSYLLNYPFIKLMLVLSVAFIMKDEEKVLKIPHNLFSLVKPVLLIACLSLLIVSCKMFYDEYSWCNIAHRSLAGETRKVMPDYEHLYKTMNRNAFFLYNYGAELNFIGETEKSNRILNETTRFYNDIDLQLLLANNYQKMKQYKEAENCLILASNMVPNRFIPLYRLVQLYKETGENEKAKDIARMMINKPVKIMSPEILYIKSEMEKELITHEDSCSKFKLPTTKSI